MCGRRAGRVDKLCVSKLSVWQAGGTCGQVVCGQVVCAKVV